MDLELRAGVLDDAATVADIATAMRPDEPVDPLLERYIWEHREDEQVDVHVGQLSGRPAAYAISQHRLWPADDEVRAASMEVGIVPEARSGARLRQLIGHCLGALRAEGCRVVESYAREDEPWLRDALVSAGLAQDHLSRVWELDLRGGAGRLLGLAEESRARSRAAGLLCLPLSECTLPDKLGRVHVLAELARLDVPRSVPALPNPKSLFLKWFRMPGVMEERYWVAQLNGELVGLSYLRFPPIRGHVWTGFTASHPGHRGKGIARAVKMETLAQAIELGVPLVRTDNDERNAPMLHINESLGYRAIPAWVVHLKRLG